MIRHACNCIADCPDLEHDCESAEHPSVVLSKHCLAESTGNNSVQVHVTVSENPFGMDVTVADNLPRVFSVAPGSHAESAGVRPGDIPVRVNGKPVTSKNWTEVYHAAKVPFTLTLETASITQLGRFDDVASEIHHTLPKCLAEPYPPKCHSEPYPLEDVFGDDYFDFHCSISSLPFGVRINGVGGAWARVQQVVQGSLAESKGVLVDDILVTVAGNDVSAGTWYRAMRDTALPYRLRFRRRLHQMNVVEEADRAAATMLKRSQDEMKWHQIGPVAIQSEQVARRKNGLEMREKQLREAELECTRVQQAVERLRQLHKTQEVLRPDEDEYELSALMERLALKIRWRDALVHDVVMWKRWVEQPGDVVRQAAVPQEFAA